MWSQWRYFIIQMTLVHVWKWALWLLSPVGFFGGQKIHSFCQWLLACLCHWHEQVLLSVFQKWGIRRDAKKCMWPVTLVIKEFTAILVTSISWKEKQPFYFFLCLFSFVKNCSKGNVKFIIVTIFRCIVQYCFVYTHCGETIL